MGAGAKPKKYGYRLGTREEALKLGMQPSVSVAMDRSLDTTQAPSVGRLAVHGLPWLIAKNELGYGADSKQTLFSANKK